MRFTITHLPIHLVPGAPLVIVEGKGTSLRVLRGRIWITQEDVPDDVFLEEGAVHTLSAAGKTVISAEGPARAAASVVFDAPLSVRSGGAYPLGWLSCHQRFSPRGVPSRIGSQRMAAGRRGVRPHR